MGPQVVHLPDGQHITVTPVFAGLFFKSNELSTHNNAFPIGWTIVIHTEDGSEGQDGDIGKGHRPESAGKSPITGRPQIHSFTRPTLQHDSLFISSISNPSSSEFKPAASPTRQLAMMLWVTLYWYFHQPAPSTTLSTDVSKLTPKAGKPRGEWRIRVKKDGVLRGRNIMPKLERMGLIANFNSAVGTALEDSDETWANMFVTRRMFWQIPGPRWEEPPVIPRIPNPESPWVTGHGEYPTIQPQRAIADAGDVPGAAPPRLSHERPSIPIGPFFSASHLPTYYPPAPLQYTITNHVRHPLRPKPPRMGEVFYTRFIPSVGQYLSFRPVPYMGPISSKSPLQPHLLNMTDSALLETWHSNPRVSAFWGEYAPNQLLSALQSRHSFPAIGLWDGIPFGYFELYWVKEDLLGRYAGSTVEDWDRGCHVLIGEEWARGRVQSWLTSLVHYLFCADYRTMSICLEPRVDNARFIQHLEYAGFTKEKEITFPHKQAWLGRFRRESWEGPAL
ncbi:hypothetical protein N0V88_007222 [Collariella sp. IMI 366227]|nr:hypothetical protein N0V88_007222 [Collariella sp. IMI 366227]